MQAVNSTDFLFITGLPGSGKTTLATAIARFLQSCQVPTIGFVTEEQRAGGRRYGFQLRLLPWGDPFPFARKGGAPTPYQHAGYFLERDVLVAAIHKVQQHLSRSVWLIVDEIGPMEWKFYEFRTWIAELLECKNCCYAAIFTIAYRFCMRHPLFRQWSPQTVVTIQKEQRATAWKTVLRWCCQKLQAYVKHQSPKL